MLPKTILVTGATGFLGSRIIEHLVSYPEVEKIVAAGRTLKATHEVRHPKISYQLGDLTDINYVQKIIKGVDTVVNCASLSSPWGRYDLFYKANISTQQHLIQVAENQGVNRFIYISTPSIYYTGKDRFDIKEKDPLPVHLVNHYARTKLAAEQLLQKASLPYVILRPRALHGRGDTVIMPRLARAVREGKLRIIGDGENVVDLTAVVNVVEAVRCALEAKLPQAQGVYNITDGKPVKLWETIKYVLEGCGFEMPKKRLPKGVALFFARIIESFALLTGAEEEPALLPYGIGSISTSVTMNIDAAREKLGYQPVQTTQQSLDEFIEWYLQNDEP